MYYLIIPLFFFYFINLLQYGITNLLRIKETLKNEKANNKNHILKYSSVFKISIKIKNDNKFLY